MAERLKIYKSKIELNNEFKNQISTSQATDTATASATTTTASSSQSTDNQQFTNEKIYKKEVV